MFKSMFQKPGMDLLSLSLVACLCLLHTTATSAATQPHFLESSPSRQSRAVQETAASKTPQRPTIDTTLTSGPAERSTLAAQNIQEPPSSDSKRSARSSLQAPLGSLTHRQLVALLGSTGLSDEEVQALTSLDTPSPDDQLQQVQQQQVKQVQQLQQVQKPIPQNSIQLVSNQLPKSVASPKPAPFASTAIAPRCLAGFSVRKGLIPKHGDIPTRLHFQETLTNIGGWDPRANEFRAPCDGLYSFSFHALSTKEEDFTIALLSDGKYQTTAYGSKGGYQWGGNSAVLLLRAGQRVYLELQQGAIYEHPRDEAYTSFSGFLVNQF